MPRRPRNATGGFVFHVLNRAVGRATLFESDEDYAAFETVLCAAQEFLPVRLLSYCLMPNHWHLVLWPRRDGELSEHLRWLTVTHTQRWHSSHGTAGLGPLYQGRFRSFPMQNDQHYLAVGRYVESNALRGKLVERAETWRWSSLWHRVKRDKSIPLVEGPVPRTRNWLASVNKPESPANLLALRISVTRGTPFGDAAWQAKTARKLGLESTLRPRGRPRKLAS